MIPQRIKLKGFLCYKDEQEVAFDGASLWMLAGINGSGKSTVFDAVTYALFGYHRGGSQHALELINKDSDRLAVEFEFTLDGQPYLAKRTLQRDPRGSAKSTFLISRRVGGGNGRGSWLPIEETDRKGGFDAWVRENIGLDYETFTSSILLLQGKAEKLLDSTAKGRFEVLAGIVDLERYEKLHKKADEQRRKQDGAVDGLHNRLAALPEVTAQALADAEERIVTTDTARQKAGQEVERLQGLEFQARQYSELRDRLARATERWREAEQLLKDAPAIEQDVARLRELRDVLPRIKTLLGERQQITDSEGRVEALTAQRQKIDGQLALKEDILKQTRDKQTALQNRVSAAEQRLRDVNSRLPEVVGQLERVKQYEQQESDLARVQAELARLPADPAAELERSRETLGRLIELNQVIPPLARLQSLREELRLAGQRERDGAAQLETIKERGQKLVAALKELEPRVLQADQARQQADDRATEARTLLTQARQSLKDVTQLEGAGRCRYCGQALTPGHVEDEQRKRRKDVEAADARAQAAAAAQQEARTHEQQLRKELQSLQQNRDQARDEFRATTAAIQHSQKESERLQRQCVQAYEELAEPFRARVSPAPAADWLATVYPTPTDLAALREQVQGLPGVQQRVRETEKVHSQWTVQKAAGDSIRQNLARLQKDLPADRQAVRQSYFSLESDKKALESDLRALRNQVTEALEEWERLDRERDQIVQQRSDLDARLKQEETLQRHARQALERAQQELPAAWQPLVRKFGLSEWNAWTVEKEELERKQTDERGRQLEQTRLTLEDRRQEKAELERQQEAFPVEARQEPAQVRTLLEEAKRDQRVREGEYHQACQQKARLEDDQRQRQEIQQKLLEAEKELRHARLLGELLGRDRLQLYLVRQAERQVVDHANAVLDRLSGGQLFLRLCGTAEGEGNSAKALELEAYNRTTGEKPINVAFLSGSQKFRVAVSLALGIGQYASRQHRPIESVIIDEGFGCLDKEGRQAMIQELQNLRGHLRCILLVSHQEEFADAFADGYRFELQDGATKVSRFQR